MKQKTVTINGTIYDGHTGKPLRVERSSDAAKRHSAHSVHTQLQRSKTLNRRYVKNHSTNPTAPVVEEKSISHPTAKSVHPAVRKPNHAGSAHKSASLSDVRRSPHVARFAKHDIAPNTRITTATPDIAPASHPLVHHVEKKRAIQTPAQRVVKPSHIIKNEAISAATAKMPAKHTKKDVTAHKTRTKFSKFVSVGSTSLAVLLLGAYLTYLNMPALSTRVAATQAGIEASYPSYQPMGYSLNGPVAYKEGTVTMKFAANGGPENYTLTQTKSGWDSSAVLEYFVTPEAGQDYTTTAANGLTIYSYGNGAAWINNGILYTIKGSATLSNNQIQRIATSL